MMDVDYVGGRRSCDSAVTWDKQEPCAVAVLLERLMGQHGAMSEGTLVLRLTFPLWSQVRGTCSVADKILHLVFQVDFDIVTVGIIYWHK